MMAEMQPLGHRVLVKIGKVKEKEGSLFLPVQAAEREQAGIEKGELVAVGPNAWKGFDDGYPWAGIGDTVGFTRYAGVYIEHDGEFYRAMNDEDLYVLYLDNEEG